MANPHQIDIRELSPGRWRLEFDYDVEFIDYLKRRVPASDRSFDSATKFWQINGDHYITALEGVAVQKFKYATKIFWRDGKEVWKNLVSGHESIQENLWQ